jgi:hypothetical protein
MSLSNYAEDKILDHTLGGTAFTQPAAIYLALHTADPTETGAVGEVTGGSYARKSVTFSAASGGSKANNSAATFTNMPACTTTHFSLWDALSGGNCLGSGALTQSRTFQLGDTATVASGAITVSLD